MALGQGDAARIPARKPTIRTFILDDRDHLWVMPELWDGRTGHRLNWCNGTGRHRGTVDLPVRLSPSPMPVIRNGFLYGVELDEVMIPTVVVVRIGPPMG